MKLPEIDTYRCKKEEAEDSGILSEDRRSRRSAASKQSKLPTPTSALPFMASNIDSKK